MKNDGRIRKTRRKLTHEKLLLVRLKYFCIFDYTYIIMKNFDMSPEVYILLKKLIFTSLGASNGDKTQRQLFHQLQSGHDEHERDIDKRRQGTFHQMSILGHRNHRGIRKKTFFSTITIYGRKFSL